jgi:hypothetical protein
LSVTCNRWWLYPGTQVSTTNKTDRHGITQILLNLNLYLTSIIDYMSYLSVTRAWILKPSWTRVTIYTVEVWTALSLLKQNQCRIQIITICHWQECGIGKFSQNYSFPSFYYGEYETAHGISLTLQIHLSFPLINNIKLLVQWNLSNQTHQETKESVRIVKDVGKLRFYF